MDVGIWPNARSTRTILSIVKATICPILLSSTCLIRFCWHCMFGGGVEGGCVRDFFLRK